MGEGMPPRKRQWKIRLPFHGVISKKLASREESELHGFKFARPPVQTAFEMMLEMGFVGTSASGVPRDLWSLRLLDRITRYRPWLQERWDHTRWRFSRAGRLLLTLQRMARQDRFDRLDQAREQRRIQSERDQPIHMAQHWAEERAIIDGDLMDVLRPIYPEGTTDAFLHAEIATWTKKERLRRHYAERAAWLVRNAPRRPGQEPGPSRGPMSEMPEPEGEDEMDGENDGEPAEDRDE